MMISTTDDKFEDFDLDDAEIMDDDWEDEFADTEPMVDAPAPSSGSSFFSRVIYPLVILLFVGGAGYFFYLKYWPALTKPRPNTVQTVEPVAAVTPPAPVDNQPSSDDNALPTFDMGDAPPMPLEAASPAVSNDGASLTPLPDLSGIDFEPLPELDLSATPSPVEDARPLAPIIPIPQINNDSVIGDLQKQNKSLSEQLTLAQAALDEKNLMIGQLKKDLAAAQNSTKSVLAAEKNKTMPSLLPPPVKAPVVSAPKKVKTVSKPRPKAVKKSVKIQWVLRSAQPGKATVSRKNSNDLKTVQVGSSLSGVGRIQSISQVSGLWIIKGTNGQIKQ